MTVLFADLSGFTSASEHMDPEDVRDIVDRCMKRMGVIAEEFGASTITVIGDQLMAVFGAPISHEDDAERAVRAALEIRRCASESPEDFGGLSIRVGVNTGETMYAPVGIDPDPTVMGDAVNTASRLQTAAPVGAVLVGAETYSCTKRSVRYQTVGPLQLKGKDSPVLAYLALEPLTAPGERPLSSQLMVGREQELLFLRRVWEVVVKERCPHLVTITGSPGIGKTRLCNEFADYVNSKGGRVLRGRSLPYGGGTGYGAFGQQVKQWAGIFDSDASSAASEKLRNKMTEILPSKMAQQVAAQLALMVGIGTDDVADQGALFLSARRFVEGLGTEQLTVIVFEDIHWSDGSLLDLIQSLACQIRKAAVLLIALARPELLEIRPDWANATQASTMLELQPLSPSDSRELLKRLLPESAESALNERLAETASGNPLFTEELVAAFTERARDLTTGLPTNLNGLILSRLDRLPPAERRALLDASVIGNTFWMGALEALTGREVADLIDSLERRGLVRRELRSTIEGEKEFSFKHILVREVAYTTLPKAARRKRHAAVAHFVEDTAGDRIGEAAALLAHHWRAAGDPARAVPHLLVAAEHAARAWAKGEAISLYTDALRLVPQREIERRRSISLRRAVVLLEDVQYARAADELDALIPQLEGREQLEALLARARAAFWLHDAERALSFGRRASELAESIGEEDLRGPALSVLSFASGLVAGRRFPEAEDLSERALSIWRGGDRMPDLAVHLAAASGQTYLTGRYAKSIEYARRGHALAQEIHAGEAMLWSGGNLGLALIGLGRHEEALRHLEQLVARGRELGTVLAMTARAQHVWAAALRELFDLEESRRLTEEGIEMAAEAAFPIAELQGRVDLLFADLCEGEVGKAEQAWPVLWEAIDDLHGFHQWVVAGRLAEARAEILLELDEPARAAEAASSAMARARATGRLKYEVHSQLALGTALIRLKRHTEAVTELRGALVGAERLKHPPSLWRAAATFARALSAGGDDRAKTLWVRAKAIMEAFAAGLIEERRERFLRAPPSVETLKQAG